MVGAILLILAGTLAGYMESHRLARRVDCLGAFVRFLSAAQTEIRFSALPVEQIVRRHGGELPFLAQCARRCGEGTDFGSAWEQAVDCEAQREGFLKKDADLLKNFGSGFGASDTEGQLSHCGLYSTLFGSSLKSAKEDEERKSKLYLMLGVCSGVAAALMLC